MPSLLYTAETIGIQSLNPTTDFVILVIGKTGSGKTTLIRNITGVNLGVNDSMQGLPTEIKMVAVKFPSPESAGHSRVVFIDTPGFDQGSLTQECVLEQRITKHLIEMKKIGACISSIVYLSAIDDPAIIRHLNQYKRQNPSPSGSPTSPGGQLQPPSVASLAEPAKSTSSLTLTEQLFQRILKWRIYYSSQSDQHSLFFLTTNWSDGSQGPDLPTSDAKLWEDFAREDLTNMWKKKISATAKPSFLLGRLSATQISAYENLAEILSFSKTSLAFTLIEEIQQATTHANQVLSTFSTLDATLKILQDSSTDIDVKPGFIYSDDSDVHLSNKDVIIAVLGLTGSGKSAFIKAVTGVDPGVNHDLDSAQTGMKIITMDRPQLSLSRIVLVDTPGFNDTNRSDLQVFKLISNWLKESYGKNALLNGIIYTHRITDNRMSGSSFRNLTMFQKLCGRKAFSGVTFVTTMWDEDPENNMESFKSREKQLKDEFLKPFIKNGARLLRHQSEGDTASAHSIISDFTADSKKALLVQKELVDYRKTLQQTQAGQAMYDKLECMIQEQQEIAGKETLEQRRKGLLENIARIEKDLNQMSLPLPPFLYNLFYRIRHGAPWEISIKLWTPQVLRPRVRSAAV
ncbi:hypothetical protein CVT24_012875 [Panaeolus cyanescens]|uniref:G domain-containing protein n=1 Tax=Panaeolus cyanescens TaxID=181874 RepID=A0A409W6K7_9AGAR|nr:hypothetical protein CVT24_012875 [Panaeolus cyanescens]